MKVVVFDMDGTLFDTKESNYYAYYDAVKKMVGGCSVSKEEFERSCYGRNYKSFLPTTYGIERECIEAIHKAKCCMYLKYVQKYARENVFLFELINNLRKTYKIVLYTTASKKNTYEILDFFNKRDLFDFILTAEDVEKLKPDTEGFYLIFDKFNVTKENVVYFDDSEKCIDSALRLGIESYLVKWSV